MKSQWAGKCKGMQTADGQIIHSWNVDDEIFYQKEPKCICINEECFKKQQAAATATTTSSSSSTSPPTTLPPRSESERTDDCSHMLEILWSMAENKSKKIVGWEQTGDKSEDFIKQQIILAEVLFKGLVVTWNRD